MYKIINLEKWNVNYKLCQDQYEKTSSREVSSRIWAFYIYIYVCVCVCVCVLSLFSDAAVAQIIYRQLTGWSVNNAFGCRRIRLGPQLRHFPGIYIQGLRKTTKKITQGSRESDKLVL
jgi:hypothetical protein